MWHATCEHSPASGAKMHLINEVVDEDGGYFVSPAPLNGRFSLLRNWPFMAVL